MSMKRWLWCLVVGAALACRGSEEEKAREEQRAREEADAGTVRVHAAQRRPDGGMPDGGHFRYKLEPVGPPEPGQCPPGQYRCCDGSCSPQKGCPQVACGAVPSFKE